MKLAQKKGLALLTLTAFAMSASSTARADWGSIRGNNRFHDEHRKVDEHRPPVEIKREERHVAQPVIVHRDRDYEVDRGHAHFWSDFWSGMLVHALPHGYVSVAVGGRPYYYYDGVYYQSNPTGYVVVAPPTGVFVPVLPTGAVALSVGGTTYFYGGGAYYLPQGNGFVVVPPPLGITVAELPPGATPVILNGVNYYLGGGTYYLAVMQGGVTVYMTVRPQ
jgi:hypothetical protein